MGTGVMAMECPKVNRVRSVNLEAVHNRRACRAAARKTKVREEQVKTETEWEMRRQKERETAARMARRFFPPNGSGVSEMPHMICLDYRYWQARRCEIDVLCKMFWDGQSDPWCDGSAWDWWVSMPYQTRDEYHRKYARRLTRF